MTEQHTAKSDKKKRSGVTLNGRFVQRDSVLPRTDYVYFNSDPDDIIACLTAYFELNQATLIALPDDPSDTTPVNDDMPRFQNIQRDGLQVPKEGKDGTGN